MSQLFHSGVSGAASVGTPPIELPITDWQVHPEAKLNRFRNSKSGPSDIVEAAWLNATVTLTIDYDFSANPFQSPALIQAGARLTNVMLYLHQSAPGELDGPAWWKRESNRGPVRGIVNPHYSRASVIRGQLASCCGLESSCVLKEPKPTDAGAPPPTPMWITRLVV